MKHWALLCVACIFIFIGLNMALADPFTSMKSETHTQKFTPQRGPILNPGRGIYRFKPLTSTTDFASTRESGATLVYSELNLAAFRSEPISDVRLADIDQAFEHIRAAGIKTIVRVIYSSAFGEPDAPLPIIELHLRQLSQIFIKHAPVIFAFQAGCIGPWGEWHSSSNHADSAIARGAVLDQLIKHLPESRQIHIRRPTFRSEYLQATPRAAERLGHHNDCLLADAEDAGTFPPGQTDIQRMQIGKDSHIVAVGGETCRSNLKFANCTKARAVFSQIGLSYLNADYHPDVVNLLKSQGCWETIESSLGYRLQPEKLTITISPNRTQLSGSIRIKSTGWAPPYQNYLGSIKIQQGDQIFHAKLIDDIKLREFYPGVSKEIRFKSRIDPKLLDSMQMAIAFVDPEIPTDSRYAIRLSAKEFSWDARTGDNVLLVSPSPLRGR